MLFDDLSCVAEKTLERTLENGIYDLIKCDWTAILSIAKSGKWKLDAKMNLNNTNIDNEIISEFINNNINIFLNIDEYDNKSYIYGNLYFSKLYIRNTDEYAVYHIYAKYNTPFSKRDMDWLQIYIKRSYEATLLNNDLINLNNYLKNILESSNSLILVVDLGLNILSYNGSIKRISNNNELLHIKKLYDLPFNNVNIVDDITSSMINNNDEKSYFTLSNHKYIYEFYISALKNNKDKHLGFVLVGNDITQNQIDKYSDSQNNIYDLISNVLMVLTRDVKKPLSNIVSSSNLMVSSSKLNNNQIKNYTEIILNETNIINKKLEEMLIYTNIDVCNNNHYTDVNNSIHNAINIISKQIAFKDISIKFNLESNIPSIKADYLDIQKTFLYVLDYLINFIDKSGFISISSYTIKDKIYIDLFAEKYDSCDVKNNVSNISILAINNILEKYNSKVIFNNLSDTHRDLRIIL